MHPEETIFTCLEKGVPLAWRKPQKVSGNVIKSAKHACELYEKLTSSRMFLACNFMKSDLFHKYFSKILFVFSKHFKILENIYRRLLTRFVKLASIDCLLSVIAAELQKWVF